MATPTTNYNLQKPTVGGDTDIWGGFINDNYDALDTILKDQENALNGATPKPLNSGTGNVIDETGHTHDVATATKLQAEAGSDSTNFMTPLRTKEHIDARKSNSIKSTDANALATSAAVNNVSGGSKITVSATAPASPSVDDVWIKT